MFHSPSLSKAVAELEPLVSDFKNKADHISDDIRSLEQYLCGKFLGVEIGVNIQDHVIDEEHMKLFKLAGMSQDLKFLLREFLIWGKDETSQKFRLLYESHHLQSNKIGGYQVISERRPLIECPLFDRLRMNSKLPILIEHVKNCLSDA